MLKKAASFVLASFRSSTYPEGYASGFHSLRPLLDGLFEHPARAVVSSSRIVHSDKLTSKRYVFFTPLSPYFDLIGLYES